MIRLIATTGAVLILGAGCAAPGTTPRPTVQPTPQEVRLVTATGATGATLVWEHSERKTLASYGTVRPKVSVSPDDAAHLVWPRDPGGRTAPLLMYQRFNNGEWRAPELVPDPSSSIGVQAVADSQGVPHLFWQHFRRTGPDETMHRMRTKDGSWTEPEDLTISPGIKWTYSPNVSSYYVAPTPHAAAGPGEALHLAWMDDPNTVWYVRRRADATWGPIEKAWVRKHPISGGPLGLSTSMVVDGDGTVHLAWAMFGVVRYTKRNPRDGWSEAQVLFQSQNGRAQPRMVRGSNGQPLLLLQLDLSESKLRSGSQQSVSRTALFLIHQEEDGRWDVPETVPNVSSDAKDVAFDTDGDGNILLASSEPRQGGGPFDRDGYVSFRLADNQRWSHAYRVPTNYSMNGQVLVSTGQREFMLVTALGRWKEPDTQLLVSFKARLESPEENR